MSKLPDKPVSADRRGFFRELFVSAIETVEELGRQMGHVPADEASTPRASGYDYDPYCDYGYGMCEYGPPWPPPLGPDIPPVLRPKLRKLRDHHCEQAVPYED